MGILTDNEINSILTGAKRIGIAGHVSPDGDCVGSCMAFYRYLKDNGRELGIKQVDVYLEPFGNSFKVLKGLDEIRHSCEADTVYDVFISLDCASLDRLGAAVKYFNTAGYTVNIDHHISNHRFARYNHVVSEASSTCEVLFEMFDETGITREIAEALYVGIINDTGIFKHTNTSKRTMLIAAKLMDKGIDFSTLIDETFLGKTYTQNQIMGRCLMESRLMLDGKVIVSSLDRSTLDFYEADHSDLDGIIDQLRATKGIQAAIFIYEKEPQVFKVSMRSNGDVDVRRIAEVFGGGGHTKAAGCTMRGTLQEMIDNLVKHVNNQLIGSDN